MGRKIFAKCFFVFLIALLAAPVGVLAKTEADVLQAYISGDVLTIFTSGRLRYDSFRCAISNQNAELNSSGKLSDSGAKVKTTVLVDVSNSEPHGLRGDIETFLKALIENKPPNEEFKIVAFGKMPETLSDFTADRYDLANAIEKIKLGIGKSKIYDAICGTIPDIAIAESQPVFYRTLLIASGAEDGGSEMTKEELFLKLQNGSYPVDILEFGEMGAGNKDLAAIARLSGGRHYSSGRESEAQPFAELFGASGYFYYTAAIPPDLLDGSIRQIDIGDNVNNMSFDLKFPVLASPGKINLQPEPIESPSASDENGSFYIMAGFALLAVCAIMVFAGAFRGKKAKSFFDPKSGLMAGGSGETEFFGDDGFHALKIGSVNNPGNSWTFSVEDELLIGRAPNCRLRLEDKSVSREQCKIIVENGKLVVVHLGSTNKTAVNGNISEKSPPLKIGDTIKFGRESLRVDYLRVPGKPVLAPSPDPLQNANKGKTALLF